jgi:hypothetical protein
VKRRKAGVKVSEEDMDSNRLAMGERSIKSRCDVEYLNRVEGLDCGNWPSLPAAAPVQSERQREAWEDLKKVLHFIHD